MDWIERLTGFRECGDDAPIVCYDAVENRVERVIEK